MAKEEKEDRTALICDDCREEIFVDVNMLMVHDELWKEIIAKQPRQLKEEDSLCACCMEKRIGRKLTREDWKIGRGLSPHPLCNYMTEGYRNSSEGIEYEKQFLTKTVS